MNNYYDLLNISQEANQSEIETVLDDQYTKWRALVTHHDNNVVAQANQALNQLEEIRSTLMSPEKRRVYNNRLLANQGNVAGLTDPDILLAQNPMGNVMAPPRPRAGGSGQAAQTEMDRTYAWICTNPNCKKANPIGTPFCVKCGTRIGLECPSCGEFVEISNKFCSRCGVNKAEFFELDKIKRIQSLQEKIKGIQTEIQHAETNPDRFYAAHPSSIYWSKKTKINFMSPLAGAAVLAFLIGVILLFVSTRSQSGAQSVLGLLLIIFSVVGIYIVGTKPNKEMVSRYISEVVRPQIDKVKQDIAAVQHEKYG